MSDEAKLMHDAVRAGSVSAQETHEGLVRLSALLHGKADPTPCTCEGGEGGFPVAFLEDSCDCWHHKPADRPR